MTTDFGGRLRFCVIGAGHLGRIHARLLRAIEAIELVGVVDTVVQSAQRVAAETGTAAHSDYRALLPHIDAAVVATPTTTHHALGMALLSRGVHVLLEKPIAANVAQADELVQAADARRLVLQIGHIERFNPALQAAMPHLDDPKYIAATRAGGYTFRSTDIGVVLDLMIHDLDVVLALVKSDVVAVQALGAAVIGPHEDIAQARIEFANGCVANLQASRTSFQPQRNMQVFTGRGYAHIDFAERTAELVCPSERLLKRELDFDARAFQHAAAPPFQLDELLRRSQLPVEQRNAIADEQQEFVHSIRTGQRPQVSGQQGRQALQVAEQILERIAHHRWSPAGPVGPPAPPQPSILSGPHWRRTPAHRADPRRRAS